MLCLYQFPKHREEKKTLKLIDVFCCQVREGEKDHSVCFAAYNQSQKDIMELFRQRLLESTTKQSDLIEIFAAIDRGYL